MVFSWKSVLVVVSAGLMIFVFFDGLRLSDQPRWLKIVTGAGLAIIGVFFCASLWVVSLAPDYPDVTTGQTIPWHYKDHVYYVTRAGRVLISLSGGVMFMLWFILFLVGLGHAAVRKFRR